MRLVHAKKASCLVNEFRVALQFASLSLGEGWGEGLSANCKHNVVAGFSPQSTKEFFASIDSVEE